MGTGYLRRIQWFSVFVKQEGKVVDKKGKFPEGSAVLSPDDSFCTSFQFFAVLDIVEGGSRFFHDQRAEYTVH